MKTKNILLGIIFITILALCCTSCDCTPIINGKNPFIVIKIVDIGNGMCEYYGSSNAAWDRNGFSKKYPSLVLPKRLFNVGDTIQINLK
jgi:hypothetical protein